MRVWTYSPVGNFPPPEKREGRIKEDAFFCVEEERGCRGAIHRARLFVAMALEAADASRRHVEEYWREG